MHVYFAGLCQPVGYKGMHLVDGGIMCNYPIHAFDGRYRPMSIEANHKFKECRINVMHYRIIDICSHIM